MNKRLIPIFLVVFIDLVGFGLIIPLLPTFAISFGASPLAIGLLTASYSAMQLIGAPVLGRLSDRFGRKVVLQASLVAFAAGSVVTALSNDLTTLVIGRLIQGVASGALLPVTLALAADLWSTRSRAAVLGGIGAAQELGSVLGPLYGIGVVWLLNTWRDVFWINIPLTLVAMVLIHFSLPSHERSEHPERIGAKLIKSD